MLRFPRSNTHPGLKRTSAHHLCNLKAYNTGHAIVNQVRTFYLCLGRKQDHEDLLKGKRVW